MGDLMGWLIDPLKRLERENKILKLKIENAKLKQKLKEMEREQ